MARDGRPRHDHRDAGRAGVAARGRADARVALPGATVSAYEQPLHTWASMPQLIDVECWPADERPGAIAYFCGSLRAPFPPEGDWRAYVAEHEGLRARQRDRAPGEAARPPAARRARGTARFAGSCSADATATADRDAIDTQFYLANIDPSDRYVQCAPGSDAYRLRAEESGYDNLVLAGDWTDNGLNAGASRRRRSRACRPPTPCWGDPAATGSRGPCSADRSTEKDRRALAAPRHPSPVRPAPRRAAPAVAGSPGRAHRADRSVGRAPPAAPECQARPARCAWRSPRLARNPLASSSTVLFAGAVKPLLV